ncbi:MAG: MFS superfamily sulfate permease-like transporter [Granulosicoccus sp.]|jgi:MFS superfamily sulfate permease-like transporter
MNLSPYKNLKSDIPASIVVFLVAMPLCLGIALASGAPLFSGLIAGIVGGVVVGSLSGSPLGVSGPAAGLAVIVLNAITELGAFEVFLMAVVLAGIIQVIMGFAKAGIIAHYFPSSVIHGMLAGIGVIIFLKQIPHAFGYDGDPEGDFRFLQVDGENTFSELLNMLDFVSPGAFIVALVSLTILVLWETTFFKSKKFTKLIQGPLVAVIAGIALNMLFSSIPELTIDGHHLVSIPIPDGVSAFVANFSFPDFTALYNPQVYVTAIVIAVVASLETLLCVEATDKLDPLKRVTPTNRELKAQGIGNIVSGLIGGLPVTQVIVRSSANIQSGGVTKTSAVLHGILLLASIILIPAVMNQIPLATLAAILLVVGYKLAKPALFKRIYSEGMGQFVPFIVTIVGMVLTDLLTGIALGMVVAVFVILYNNFRVPFTLTKENLSDKENIRIGLSQDVTFLNKASIRKTLSQIPDDSNVEIDASKTHFMHHDVLEIIEDFKVNAESRNITVQVSNLGENLNQLPPLHYNRINGK